MKQKYSYLHIRSLRARGFSLRDIAREVGCHKDTVVRALSDDIDEIRKKERDKKRNQRLRPRTKICHNGLNQKSARGK